MTCFWGKNENSLPPVKARRLFSHTSEEALVGKSILPRERSPDKRNFEEEYHGKSSQTVEERILAAFMQLTEENKLRVLAMAAVMQENGEAIRARTA